ncbi:MAG: type I methionyl aminopeptidase [Candidatus Pacebacteria bacterium]|nr:type I methionyl aminopeptidase [Candidatus Paceibacterota bacterium]
MAIIIKTPDEIEKLREGGKRLATVLAETAKQVRAGISALELDTFAQKMIADYGDEAAFLGYKPAGHYKAYPASLIVSVNSEVVHGIPTADKILKEGDIVSLDLGIKHAGLFTDHAITVAVGTLSKDKQKLLDVTRNALYEGIEAIKPNARVGDIGYAVSSYAKSQGKYGIVEALAGHGVGRAIHEDPFIPNFGKKGTGEKLVAGMVIAIEPMLTLGTKHVIDTDDGYTIKTEDGSAAAHFEHTVLVTETGYEILTLVP